LTVAISCTRLSKQYKLGERESYKALRDVITDAATAPYRAIRGRLNNGRSVSQNAEATAAVQQTDRFWALKDVSLEVPVGEVIGIVGRNGAGKSTLLKILTRITKPTSGTARIHGRVGSLLEVGTGFHPELTGRENIYLNAAILGMGRAEVARKFDEIVAFAEVEQFIDTPVKRYSSGMYVRLAFAVAAHLDTEILLVDEVLAVGDAAFQAKCLGKMGDVARTGRTIVFVSHNMAAVSNLCTSAVLLAKGNVVASGATSTIISRYLESAVRTGGAEQLDEYRPAWAVPWITGARVVDRNGAEQSSFPLEADMSVEMDFVSPDGSDLQLPVMGIVINHLTMGIVAGVNTRMTRFEIGGKRVRAGTMSCSLERVPFLQGSYSIDVWLGDGPNNLDVLMGYVRFTLEETDVYGTGNLPFSHQGVILLKPKWHLRDAAGTIE
jgi:lipopolysaccharide transport system ATP-binding protein